MVYLIIVYNITINSSNDLTNETFLITLKLFYIEYIIRIFNNLTDCLEI